MSACRPGCGACCIAPSISAVLPALPHGKPAGVRCPHLTADIRCALFGSPDRPAVCAGLRAGPGDILAGVFATTFLGHQGWMVRTDRTCLLIDPLLREDFGDVHALSYRVFPPRVVTVEAFPRIDALLLSHEHDDHFDIPSLATLDRRIPVYLSARSSSAARDILATMGFTVHPWLPGAGVRIGDLEALAFAGDHVTVNCGDEWDTLPYLIRSTEGHGSFLSMVDIPLTQRHVEWAAEKTARPGLVSWTNNMLDWSHMAEYLQEQVEGTQKFFLARGTGHKLLTTL